MPLTEGTRLGSYAILSAIGAGGMGACGRGEPDNRRLVLFGPTATRRREATYRTSEGGAPVAFTPEGVELPVWWALAVSPDGRRVTLRGLDGVLGLWPVAGGAPEPLHAFPREAVPLAWGSDGRNLIIARPAPSGWAVNRFDMASGREQAVREITAREPSGLRATFIAASRDGRYFVHSYARVLVDLYLAEGIR
jgi:hypothetical protein